MNQDNSWDDRQYHIDTIISIQKRMEQAREFLETETLAERPYFSDRQAMAFEDLTPGSVVIDHLGTKKDDRFLVLTAPYQLESSGWVVGVTRWPLRRPSLLIGHCLADYCVYPYENGRWNLSNWLEVADEVVSAEVVEMVKKTGIPAGVTYRP